MGHWITLSSNRAEWGWYGHGLNGHECSCHGHECGMDIDMVTKKSVKRGVDMDLLTIHDSWKSK